MNEAMIKGQLEARTEQIVNEVISLASHESPSRAIKPLGILADRVSARWVELGGRTEIIVDDSGASHVVGRFGPMSDQAPALIVGHFDTVWPIGTLARMPLRREGGRLYGPGVYDMKGSLAMLNAVLELFQTNGLQPARPVLALFTADEEIGSIGSRTLIESLAKTAAHVLVVEPPLTDGGLKTARKGVGRFTVEVAGKAAHSGVAPEQGASAIVEMAHQILRLNQLNDLAAGTTVNVGVVQGGTTSNVVPADAKAEVDVRAKTLAAAAALEAAIAGFSAITPGTRLHIHGGFNRPPMERTPAVAALFEKASVLGRRVGLDLTEGSTGGGSDGNFTAALGVATLDGLGVRGGGAHADDEHIEIDSLPERAALLATLLLNL